MESRVTKAIEINLERIGRVFYSENFHQSKDEELEFFSFKTTEELGIVGINPDGTLIGIEGTIRGAIEDDLVSIDDAISLLEDLEQIQN